MLTIRGIVANVFMRMCSLFPLQDKVVLSCFDGKMAGDNPEALYRELKRKKPNWKYVWMLDQYKKGYDDCIVVKPYSFRSLFELSTARLWIDNSRKKKWVYKRKKQYYVQTWHADVALKKVEKDAASDLSSTYIENAKYDSTIIDVMLSGSQFSTTNYRNAFWYKGDILELGYPISAIFHENPERYIEKVRNTFAIDNNVKIALYCPTFRSNDNLDVYNIDYNRLVAILQREFGGKWVVIVRLHPKLKRFQSSITYNNVVLNASDYSSTNELIVACDLLITDYSSCMFYGLEAHKIVMLYASDIDDYTRNERGLYFDIKKLPFPLAQNNDELERIIVEFDNEKYRNEAQRLYDQIGYKTTADSTEQIVEYILNEVAKRV